jgi:hypothetical protein
MSAVSRLARRAACAACAALLAASGACGGGADPRSYVERAVALAPEIERVTGLKFVSPPKVEVRTGAQVKAFVQAQLEDSLARGDVASAEAVYKRLGLLPDDVDLRALLVRVLSQQIVGYYDPRSKTLFVVDGADSAAAETTLRHELVHALQDQHVNLDSLERASGGGDRGAAVHAALEGQATYAQFTSSGIAIQAPGAWERVRQQIRDNMERMPVLSDAPFVVRETLLFPYLSGAEYARRFVDRGGADSLLARLPASTEQVLHADAFFGPQGGAPDAPTAVTLPPLGGTVAHAGSIGEFEARLLLYHHLEDLDQAARASIGWDGDRYAIARLPQGEALVWLTVWDTPQDAAEFYDALGQTLPRRYPDSRLLPAPSLGAGVTARLYSGGAGRGILLRAGEIGGRSVVLYVDAPPGAAPTSVVDFARVTLRE